MLAGKEFAVKLAGALVFDGESNRICKVAKAHSVCSIWMYFAKKRSITRIYCGAPSSASVRQTSIFE